MVWWLCCLFVVIFVACYKIYHYYLVVILSLFCCSLFRRKYRQYIRLTSGIVNINTLVILVISQRIFQSLRYIFFMILNADGVWIDAQQGANKYFTGYKSIKNYFLSVKYNLFCYHEQVWFCMGTQHGSNQCLAV